jgi:hypothetical protein
MLAHKVLRPLYRLLQRIFVLEAVAVMTARTAEVSVHRITAADLEALVLTHGQLQHFMQRGEAPYCESLCERLGDPRLTCVGVVAGGHLLSFAWFHQGCAEAAMNYGRTPATATPILLTPDAAFVFHAYTAPQARGQRLLTAVLAHAATWLVETHDVKALVTTTETVNDAARAAFRRASFIDAGTYWRYGLGKRVFGWYPRPQAPIVAYGAKC